MSRTRRRGRPPHDDVLTPTEWRVVHAIQHGMSNRDIAARRGISVDAVKYHVANVLAKLGVAEQPAGPESILYLRVSDIRAAYQQLRARGVEFLGAPHRVHRHGDGTEEWLAHFKDPEGRPLAVMSQVRR